MDSPTVPRGRSVKGAVFPAAHGDYVLWLALGESMPLVIGRLGAFDFPAGMYAYVGSARGPGGLAGRLKHHLTPVQRPHWHIDYLRAAARMEAVWWWAGDEPLEHRWAAALSQLSEAQVIVSRFGASDCRCSSHLYCFGRMPVPDDFARRVGVIPVTTPVVDRQSLSDGDRAAG